MRRRGFTVLEAALVLLILSFLTLAIFGLFSMGSRGFQHAVMRSGLQGDARRVGALLERDFHLTHWATIGVVERTVSFEGLTVHRDAVVCHGLSDWSNPANFINGISPRWDRYIVFYATQEQGPARLVHQKVEPGGTLPNMLPYPALGVNIDDEPKYNNDVYSTGILSQSVLSFMVEKDEADQLLNVSVKFRGRGRKAIQTEKEVDETHEVVYSLRALNTFPEL
ncbi:MAG: hypothetical protein KC910_31210 [Candidatus Eremiobacteraeota bacterium]|nr:hypothetical protein [Candidatus Eremiobacteraeota bacterium]